MIRRIQLLGAGAFIAFALVFAASQALAPAASAAQTGYGCCSAPADCPGGMQCTGPATNCPPQNPSYKGTCVQATPGPQTPISVPSPSGGIN